MNKKETTKKQDRVIDFFRHYRNRTGKYPSCEEARNHLGYRSASSIQRMLLTLRDKGLMKNPRWGVWEPVVGKKSLEKLRIGQVWRGLDGLGTVVISAISRNGKRLFVNGFPDFVNNEIDTSWLMSKYRRDKEFD